jgi:hypothetical protein
MLALRSSHSGSSTERKGRSRFRRSGSSRSTRKLFRCGICASQGEIDTRGPWNEGGDWEFMSSPALSTTQPERDAHIRTESSPPIAPEGINELLVDELRDILHAEKQLTRPCPKWRRRHDSTAYANALRNI